MGLNDSSLQKLCLLYYINVFWCLIYAFCVLFNLFIPDLIRNLHGGGNAVRSIQNNSDKCAGLATGTQMGKSIPASILAIK